MISFLVIKISKFLINLKSLENRVSE